MKRIIFPNSTYDQNKYCMLLTVTLLVARTKFVVVLKLFAGYIKWWTSGQTSTDYFVVGLPNNFNISPFRQAVVIVPPPRSVVRGSAEAPLISAKSGDVIVVRNVCAVAERWSQRQVNWNSEI